MTGSILSYQQEYSVKLLCQIDLKKLFAAPKQRERFNNKWNDFKKSHKHNNKIFELKGDVLKYQSEQPIPSKSDDRIPLLLVLGNRASHSVKDGVFFSFGGNKNEHCFWKNIIAKSDVYVFCFFDQQNQKTVDPMNLREWRFFIISVDVINHRCSGQKSISLEKVLTLNPFEVSYEEKSDCINQTC